MEKSSPCGKPYQQFPSLVFTVKSHRLAGTRISVDLSLNVAYYELG